MIKNDFGIELMSVTLHNAHWPLDGKLPELLISKLSHLGLINIDGDQSASFIHGQITADVTGLQEDEWCWGAHCDPKGKMLASFRLFKAQQSLWMLMPKSTVAVDLPQLQKYAAFSQVGLTDKTNDKAMFGIAGEQAETFITQRFGDVTQAVTQFESAIILRDENRFIIILDNNAAVELVNEQTVFESSSWQALEIQAGYPNISANHSSEYIPQMCNLDALDGISFTKGCYMGQETVARMKYRGGNKRALYILSGTVSSQLTKDGFVEIKLENGHRKAGNIIEYVQRDLDVLMTAVLANNTESSATFRVGGDTDSTLSIQALPYELNASE